MKQERRLHNTQGLVILSAVMYASTTIFPHCCAGLVFIFLMPLFYVPLFQEKNYTFVDGCIWGIVYFSIHLSALLFYFISQHQLSSAIFLWLVLIFYCAVQSGVWLTGASYLASFKIPIFMYRSGVWISTTTFFFWWVRWYIFWPLSLPGYCFGSPLLPLAAYPSFLYLLPVVGSNILLVTLISFSFCAVAFIKIKNYYYLLSALLFFLPFIVGFVLLEKQTENQAVLLDVIRAIGYVVPPAGESTYPLDCAQEIDRMVQRYIITHPEKKIIIMPESAFPFCINEFSHVIDLWQKNCLSDDHILCIGTHLSDKGKTCNILRFFNANKAILDYVKKKLMPYAEYLPPIWKKIKWFRTFFLKNKNGLSIKKNNQDLFVYHSYLFDPYICSDLFFGTIQKYHNDFKNKVIGLCVVNDRWFCCAYMRHLMYLFARFTAIEYCRPFIYVGHFFGRYISTIGAEYDL